jgi:hypothetical protein
MIDRSRRPSERRGFTGARSDPAVRELGFGFSAERLFRIATASLARGLRVSESANAR